MPDEEKSEYFFPQNKLETSQFKSLKVVFLALGRIACLTPRMRSGLERLITATPADLLKLHNKPDCKTKQWVKHLGPIFYPTSIQGLLRHLELPRKNPHVPEPGQVEKNSKQHPNSIQANL
jgi:hypothetical protein